MVMLAPTKVELNSGWLVCWTGVKHGDLGAEPPPGYSLEHGRLTPGQPLSEDAIPWRWRNRSWWQQGCGCHSDVPTCQHLGREHTGLLTDAFPKQAVVSSGMCHQRPAVTAGCAAAGRHKHTGLSCAVIENTSPRSSGRGAVGWDGRAGVPLSPPGPLPSFRELQCLPVAQEDIKFNGCPEIIISGKHSLISVCLAGFYFLPSPTLP